MTSVLDQPHRKDREIQEIVSCLGPHPQSPLCEGKHFSSIQQEATHGTELGFQIGGDRAKSF